MTSVVFKLVLKWHRRSWIPSHPLFSGFKTFSNFCLFFFFFLALAPQGLVHTAWTWQPLLTPELTARSTSRCAHNKVGKNWSQLAAHPIHHFMPETQTGVTPSAWSQFFTEAAPLGQNPLDWHKPPSAQRVSCLFVFYHYGCSLFLRLKYIFPIKFPWGEMKQI